MSIKNAEWDRNEKAQFTFEIEDTLGTYDLYLNIRHSGQYQYKNLYLFTEMQSPTGMLAIDTAQMIFADTRGKWMGKGIGDIYDYQFKYKQAVHFSEVGKYQFYIEQAMRTETLPYLTDIGLQIEKIKK